MTNRNRINEKKSLEEKNSNKLQAKEEKPSCKKSTINTHPIELNYRFKKYAKQTTSKTHSKIT